MASRYQSPDLLAEEDEELMYGHLPPEAKQLEGCPPKPINHSKTFPFHELFTTLFNPLSENNKKKAPAAKAGRGREGGRGAGMTAYEQRDNIISRFISRWRQDVGNDFYPALRLILPANDKDRAMYGLKEKAIAKLIVKMLKIAVTSDDAQLLLNWKLPGKADAAQKAGDFAGRCHAVLLKRQMRSEVGNMRIAEVNALLDKLSVVSKEEDQLPVFNEFYQRMNADELLWLIRIILRQMKVGASEKTLLNLWHPDGESEFNHTSSLKSVCWRLTDPEIRVSEERGIEPMQCFQPQLAQFSIYAFGEMVQKLCPEQDPKNSAKVPPKFWIEEKLDGERIQMHMVKDNDVKKYPGGFRFGFWSRKGKDYTYLYGKSFEDDDSALTRHLKDAFDPGVESIILDGEMITWDPVTNTIVGFGTLKSAAISERANPYDGTGNRPLFRAFDCLYLNGKDITKYVLVDRRAVMKRCVRNVDKRLEIHEYLETSHVEDIDKELRRVVAESSEGLVLKNPRSPYQLNSRNDNWIKVKPEYMTGFGESFDCVVIGAYYGQGHRGGKHASFLCGVRADENHIKLGANPMKCFSFFKVGGGFSGGESGDLAKIRFLTEGKWQDWDKNNPPNEYIKLGGGETQHERPDQWIKPCDSFVLEAKAASLGGSDRFATGFTLRFPRFKRLRQDKTWEDTLNISEFEKLKDQLLQEQNSKAFQSEGRRKTNKKIKTELVIAGNDTKIKTPYAGPETQLFEGLNFCVMSEMLHPSKKSKAAIEQIIKTNGGSIVASSSAHESVLCIGDKRTVPVAGLMKAGNESVVKPAWILDAIKQAEIDGSEKSKFILPFEPRHMFHITNAHRGFVEGNVDVYGDSYTRDYTTAQLKLLMDDMTHPKNLAFDPTQFVTELEERGRGLGELETEIFRRCVVKFIVDELSDDIDLFITKQQFLFAGGKMVEDDDDDNDDEGEEEEITHFVLLGEHPDVVKELRQGFSRRGGKVPKIVKFAWVGDSWREKTLLDEDRYTVTN